MVTVSVTTPHRSITEARDDILGALDDEANAIAERYRYFGIPLERAPKGNRHRLAQIEAAKTILRGMEPGNVYQIKVGYITYTIDTRED